MERNNVHSIPKLAHNNIIVKCIVPMHWLIISSERTIIKMIYHYPLPIACLTLFFLFPLNLLFSVASMTDDDYHDMLWLKVVFTVYGSSGRKACCQLSKIGQVLRNTFEQIHRWTQLTRTKPTQNWSHHPHFHHKVFRLY